MKNFLILIVCVLIITMFVGMYQCARKSKPLGGFYKAINVCGRWYNYFMVDFLAVGVFGVTAALVTLVMGIMGKLKGSSGEPVGLGTLLPMVLMYAAGGAVIFLLGCFMYKRVYAKCPDDLKSRFLKDMLVMGIGTAVRIGLFVLMFVIKTWWEFSKPTEYTVNGQTVYAFPGSNDLYDGWGTRVGVANEDRTKAVMV